MLASKTDSYDLILFSDDNISRAIPKLNQTNKLTDLHRTARRHYDVQHISFAKPELVCKFLNWFMLPINKRSAIVSCMFWKHYSHNVNVYMQCMYICLAEPELVCKSLNFLFMYLISLGNFQNWLSLKAMCLVLINQF